jgi:hypothetical protein
MPTARDRVHVSLDEIDSAVGHLRNAARHLDHVLTGGELPPVLSERLIMLSDQLVATSDVARGFGTDLAGIDTELRGTRRTVDEAPS